MARKLKPHTKGAKPVANGVGGVFWWSGLGSSALVIISPASMVMLVALLSPILLLAMLSEDSHRSHILRASLALGIAASLHPLLTLWRGDATLSDAFVLIRQPSTVFPAWIAIGAAWFIGELASMLLCLTAELAAASTRRSLAANVAALEEEWGPLLPPDTTNP